MNLSAEHIEGLASEIGFRPETLEKVIRLGEFAADVGRHLSSMDCTPTRFASSPRSFSAWSISLR